jgi:hypothetical protein
MTARADDAERRLAAIELRFAGIHILLVDARRWLTDSLMSGDNAHLECTSEAAARDRLLNALEHAHASAGEDAILPVSSADQEGVVPASLAAWVTWVAMAF